MPSKKKGKKSAGNPTRGFATVSLASKNKAPVEPHSHVTSTGSEEQPKTIVTDGRHQSGKPPSNVNEQADLSSLTPEEFQAQLEEDELQLMVDKYGDASKREATRAATRSKTERRILRGQSEPLNIRVWLSEQVQDQIMDIISTVEKKKAFEVPERSTANQVVSDDLIARIWQLRQTLSNLDFLSEDIDQCLNWLVISPFLAGDNVDAKRRSDTWLLDQCLSWLGLNCPSERLPDYFTHQNSSVQKKLHEEELERKKKRQQDVDASRHSAEQKDIENSNAEITDDISQDAEDSPIEDEDFDPDNPDHLTDKYLKIMKRLHRLEPSLTEVIRQSKKKGKMSPKNSTGNTSAKVQNLLRSIKSLESDMLFDAEKARQLWSSQRQGLMMEDISRKKLGLDKSQNDQNLQKSEIQVTNHNDEQDDDENDAFTGLSDFMSSLPEQDITTEPAESAALQVSGEAIHLKDFGKWSGLHPRRIFEEVCRSRDNEARMTFHPIKSGVSRRHEVELQWSLPQSLHLSCPVLEVTLDYSSTYVRISMSSISTPDDNQSEAYIATVALFALFASSPKEERAYLRLPHVWRELYLSLREKEKSRAEAADRAELRSVRCLLESSFKNNEGLIAQPRIMGPISSGNENAVAVTSEHTKATHDSESIKKVWSSKSSSGSFKRMEIDRSTLPIWSFKSDLLTAIDKNQVVIVCGETGCGKSTQTPNFILESEMSQGRDCKIYCAQPRRISAISLARRVSQELGEKRNDLGTTSSLVGYSIRLESKTSSSSRLVYATTGIVMRMLERDPGLKEVTHLILDEVHERTIDSDFLLIVLRRMMAKRTDLKVVLMSATVNAQRFSQYLGGAPVFTIPGRTFPVEVKYLEDAIETVGFDADLKESSRKEDEDGYEDDIDHDLERALVDTNLQGYSSTTKTTLKKYNEYKINYDLIVKLLGKIAKEGCYEKYSKAILVFLPGINEIRRLNDLLLSNSDFGDEWQIFPLHSTISSEDQERAFHVPPVGIRKIVLATNIAETGITIPDITCVIDTGTHREMRYDERRQLSRLIESFISRANAKQRRGRAGRVQDGLCFHLFTRARHDRTMSEHQTPEMMRLSLQDLVLRVKMCQLGNVEQSLSEALDPPTSKNVRRAIDYLVDVKALTISEELTPLGRQLAKLPLDVFLGKMIIIGSIFGCLDSCLSIAAILSSRSPFSAPLAAKTQADQVRLAFKKGDSDLLTVYNAYCAWRRVSKTPGASALDFCRRNYLNSQTLGNIEELKGQLATSLIDAGFLVADEPLRKSLSQLRSYFRQRHFVELPKTYTANDSREVVVNSVIAWSFYPKLLMREGRGWRNVSSNQVISLHPSSVNKGGVKGKYLSYYHLMQSAGKSYNAHETNAVDDFAVALACGDAEFKLYSGITAIDSNRVRFALPTWKSILLLKHLRNALTGILTYKFKHPTTAFSKDQQLWLEIIQKCFEDRSGIVNGE